MIRELEIASSFHSYLQLVALHKILCPLLGGVWKGAGYGRGLGQRAEGGQRWGQLCLCNETSIKTQGQGSKSTLILDMGWRWGD
jgi:hypothetical protein